MSCQKHSADESIHPSYRQIAAIDDQISSLRQLRSVLQKERQSLLQQASSEQARQTLPLAKKKNSAEILLDYTRPSEPFEWASQLKKTMEKVWGITSFR
jgi:ATP-dependent DNA helicase Q1